MVSLGIRQAQPADWRAIWPIWHAVVAAGDTYVWPPDTDEPTARGLWMRPLPAVQFVAEDPSGRHVFATALLQPANPGLGDHVANAAFMVDPEHAGTGIGRRLAEYVLDEARRQGYRAMQFNAVVETNVRAVALWRSLGFTTIGTVPAAFRHRTRGLVGVHIMHRRL